MLAEDTNIQQIQAYLGVESKRVYDATGQAVLVEASTGRSLHPLEADSARLADSITRLQGELAQIKANPDYSEEYKGKQATQRQAQIEQYLDGSQGDYYTRASAEFEGLQAERQRLLTERRMSDPRGATLPIGLARLEGIARTARNLGEFQAAYERALQSDPALAFAFQLQGAGLARERWPMDPANGSFGPRLARDEAAFFESDASRALLAKAETLYHGLAALNTISRGFWRAKNGIATPGLNTHSRNIEQLQWSVGSYLGEQAGQVMADEESGRAGGVYWPSAMPAFIEG